MAVNLLGMPPEMIKNNFGHAFDRSIVSDKNKRF
jgi:hypothetical protein